MPFIKPEDREPLLKGERQPATPGEMCFMEYVPLMDAWKKERRWTTVHNEFKRMMKCSDEDAAKFLAILEFYVRHVKKYEKEMSDLNGDIYGR